MKEYAIYDTKDYEQLVYMGTIKEIAKFLKSTPNSIRSYISRKKSGQINRLINKRYEIVEITEDEECAEEKTNRKSNEKIFRELIKAFTPQKRDFEIFDSFKWKLKGIKDKIIIDEEWKQIEKFHYSLSNYGRVRNDLNKKIKNPRFHRWILQVDIYEDGKRYTVNIKRLVAHYFIRELNENEKVITKDGDIRNNYYKNLEIVSK